MDVHGDILGVELTAGFFQSNWQKQAFGAAAVAAARRLDVVDGSREVHVRNSDICRRVVIIRHLVVTVHVGVEEMIEIIECGDAKESKTEDGPPKGLARVVIVVLERGADEGPSLRDALLSIEVIEARKGGRLLAKRQGK